MDININYTKNSVPNGYSPPVSPETRLLGDAERRLMELNYKQDLQNLKMGNLTFNLDWAMNNLLYYQREAIIKDKVGLYDTLWSLSAHDYTVRYWLKNYPSCVVEIIKTADRCLKLVVTGGMVLEDTFEYMLALASVATLANIVSLQEGPKFMRKIAFVNVFYDLTVWALFHLDYMLANDLKKQLLRLIYFVTLDLHTAGHFRCNERLYKVLQFCLQPNNPGDIIETSLMIIQNLLFNITDSKHSLYVVERLPARDLKYIAIHGEYNLKQISEFILRKAENIFRLKREISHEQVQSMMFYNARRTSTEKSISPDRSSEEERREAAIRRFFATRKNVGKQTAFSDDPNRSNVQIAASKRTKRKHKRKKSEKNKHEHYHSRCKFIDRPTSSDMTNMKSKRKSSKTNNCPPKKQLVNKSVSCHKNAPTSLKYVLKNDSTHEGLSPGSATISCEENEIIELTADKNIEVVPNDGVFKDVTHILDGILHLNRDLIDEITSLSCEIKVTCAEDDDDINQSPLINRSPDESVVIKESSASFCCRETDSVSPIEINRGVGDSRNSEKNLSLSCSSSAYDLDDLQGLSLNVESSVMELIQLNKLLLDEVFTLRNQLELKDRGVDYTDANCLLKINFAKTDIRSANVSEANLHKDEIYEVKSSASKQIVTKNMGRLFVSVSTSTSIIQRSVATQKSLLLENNNNNNINNNNNNKIIVDVVNKTVSKVFDITNTLAPEIMINNIYDEIKGSVTDNVLRARDCLESARLFRIRHQANRFFLKSNIVKKKKTLMAQYLKHMRSKSLNILYINISYAMQNSSCLIHPYVQSQKNALPTIKNLKSDTRILSVNRRCYIKSNKLKVAMSKVDSKFVRSVSPGSCLITKNYGEVLEKISRIKTDTISEPNVTSMAADSNSDTILSLSKQIDFDFNNSSFDSLHRCRSGALLKTTSSMTVEVDTQVSQDF